MTPSMAQVTKSSTMAEVHVDQGREARYRPSSQPARKAKTYIRPYQ